MADTNSNQTSANRSRPPADTEFERSGGVDRDVEFASAAAPMDDEETLSGGTTSTGADATTTGEKLKAGAQKLVGQAGDRARGYAEDGKAKVGEALDGVSQMIGNAAGDVDERLGEQYGQYARSAAEAVSSFSERVKDADLDEIVEEVREFVTKSPAVAIGAAAAIGFVLVRLIRSGLDADRA